MAKCLHRSRSLSEPFIFGRYANYFQIGYSRDEIVFDFGQAYEGEAPQRHTRIVVQPRDARILLQMLEAVLAQYAAEFPEGGRE